MVTPIFRMKVPGMTNIISIAAGSDASVALDGNGDLWQWGQGIGSPLSFSSLGRMKMGIRRLSPQYVDFYNGHLPDLTPLEGDNQTKLMWEMNGRSFSGDSTPTTPP